MTAEDRPDVRRCFWCSCPLARCNDFRGQQKKCCPDCRHDGGSYPMGGR